MIRTDFIFMKENSLIFSQDIIMKFDEEQLFFLSLIKSIDTKCANCTRLATYNLHNIILLC